MLTSFSNWVSKDQGHDLKMATAFQGFWLIRQCQQISTKNHTTISQPEKKKPEDKETCAETILYYVWALQTKIYASNIYLGLSY